jgi:hypothetical protein
MPTFRELYVRYIDIADIDYINVGYPCTRKLEFARRLNRLEGYQDRVDTFEIKLYRSVITEVKRWMCSFPMRMNEPF